MTMSGRGLSVVVVAGAGWLIAVVATVAGFAVWTAAGEPLHTGFLDFEEPAVIGFTALQLSFASMGALLVVRRPANPIGWLLLLVGIEFGVSMTAVLVAVTADASAAAPAGLAKVAALIALATWPPAGLAMITTGFLFPTGRPQSARWARLLVGLLVVWGSCTSWRCCSLDTSRSSKPSTIPSASALTWRSGWERHGSRLCSRGRGS